MSTPHQGPGLWRQGDREGALDWLASLDTNQQRDLQRVMSAMGTARPMLDRMARVREIGDEQLARLGAFGSLQLDKAGDFAGRKADWAADFSQRQWHRLAEFSQRSWNRADEGLTSLRKKASETKDRVVSNVSRWWDKRRGAATTRSAMVHAAFSASRQDPDVLRTIQQTGTTSKELKQLNELMASAMYSPDTQTREQAFAQLEAAWRVKNGLTEQQAQAPQSQPVNLVKESTSTAAETAQPQQPGITPQPGTGQQPSTGQQRGENLAAWVNQGQTPAAGAVSPERHQQSADGEAPQPGAPSQSHTRAGKPPEQGR